LCSGCEKITTPITGDGYEIKGSPKFDLSGRLAIVYVDHDKLALSDIQKCLLAGAAGVIVMNTKEDDPERLVDFGTDPPVSFDAPVVTVSYAAAEKWKQHAPGSICIAMARAQAKLRKQKVPQEHAHPTDEMLDRIEHYRTLLSQDVQVLYSQGNYSCSFGQRGIVDAAKIKFMEQMQGKMPVIVDIEVDGNRKALTDFETTARQVHDDNGCIEYKFLFCNSGTKEECYGMMQSEEKLFYTTPAYSHQKAVLGSLYCVLAIVLTGSTKVIEGDDELDESLLFQPAFDSITTETRKSYRISNATQALKMFCIKFRVPPTRMLPGFEPSIDLIDVLNWTANEPECADLIAGILQNPNVRRDVPNIDRIADRVSARVVKLKQSGDDNSLPSSELAAIVMYTDEEHGSGVNVYGQLNDALRARGSVSIRQTTETWGDFMYFMVKGLEMLDSFTGVCYRGMQFPKKEQALLTYRNGLSVQWGAFSSTSTCVEKAKGFLEKASGILFKIDIHSGHSISRFSLFQDESEILLLPMTQFKVKSEAYIDDQGYTIIDMEEIIDEKLPFS
jgi:hypothetical protein